MRILRNIVLMFFPILIMVNLYRFIFGNALYNATYEYRGLAYLYNYMSTFNGLNGTFDILDKIVHTATDFATTEVVDLETLFQVVGDLFTMLGYVFAIPVMIVVDIVKNVIWVIGVFGV